MQKGELSILNVGTGDTKLSFNKDNPAEVIRSGRIVRDMMSRGYVLLVEIEENGVKKHIRAKDFDEKTSEYIIADFDPNFTREEPEIDGPQPQDKTSEPRQRKAHSEKRVPAEDTSAVAVPRRAGG